MKKLLGIAVISFTLAGCSSVAPAPKPTAVAPTVSYGIPDDCEIKELIALDPSYEALDQTEPGAKAVRTCVVGTPNSDVGIFFEYKATMQPTWDDDLLPKAKADGYAAFDAGLPDVEVLRMQSGNDEEGTSCTMQGHMGGISFTIMEPWSVCDDQWDKELVGYVVNHSKVSSK